VINNMPDCQPHHTYLEAIVWRNTSRVILINVWRYSIILRTMYGHWERTPLSLVECSTSLDRIVGTHRFMCLSILSTEMYSSDAAYEKLSCRCKQRSASLEDFVKWQ